MVDDNRVILYSLYKFMEKCNLDKEFHVSYLYDEDVERDGVSPVRIFGLYDEEELKSILLGLSATYPDFINATFTNDLKTITLRDKTSKDVLELLRRTDKMPNKELKYCEYFNVNEKYFPCIDESAINSGVSWQATYPHEAFISLLNGAEKMLGGITNKSLWIHGAYGTGKSQCAYALKKILEAPEAEVRAYWDQYEALSKNKVLLEKLIGHKEQGIVTAYRYASAVFLLRNNYLWRCRRVSPKRLLKEILIKAMEH